LLREHERLKASIALDKMAENARELGLDYEPAPVQEVRLWAVFCGGCRKEWSVPYQHPGKSICAECEAKCKDTPPTAQPAVQEGRDWSLLEATQESLREHMAEIKRLKTAQPAPVQSLQCAHCHVTIEALNDKVTRTLAALDEWHSKTDWVQETAQPLELGMHRADVLKQRIEHLKASIALDKMAENARELGLSYDDEPKIGCVNHDCDQCKAVGEIKTELKMDHNGSFTITDAHSTADVVRWLLTQDTKETILCLIDEESQPAVVDNEAKSEAKPAETRADTGVERGGQLAPVQETVESPDDWSDWKVTPPAPQPVPVKTYHDGKPWPVAPKPWVGLTDAEVEAYDSWADFQVGCGRQTLFDMVRDIEAKLKGKNHD
jgi:hypothetical protein